MGNSMSPTPLWTGPIVDAHQHFWDPVANNHPWLKPESNIPFRYGDYAAIKRRYLPDDYLDEAARLARDFPRTLMILNHAGLPSDRSAAGLAGWHAAMARFASAPNVRVKISGLGQRGRRWLADDNRWIVEEIVAMFGADRA